MVMDNTDSFNNYHCSGNLWNCYSNCEKQNNADYGKLIMYNIKITYIQSNDQFILKTKKYAQMCNNFKIKMMLIFITI